MAGLGLCLGTNLFEGSIRSEKTAKPIELHSCMCFQVVNFMHVLASRAKHELKGKQCYYYYYVLLLPLLQILPLLLLLIITTNNNVLNLRRAIS